MTEFSINKLLALSYCPIVLVNGTEDCMQCQSHTSMVVPRYIWFTLLFIITLNKDQVKKTAIMFEVVLTQCSKDNII